MPSVLLITTPDAPDIEADLGALGVPVVGRAEPATLLREAARSGATACVAWDPYPAAGLLQACDALRQHAPLPVLLFTQDADVGTLGSALDSGVHAYVVNGYAPARLRTLLALARARFERDVAARRAHADLERRFEERKLVERAKGILMQGRQISEDEAFRLLRDASMAGQEKVGRISQRVIDAARDADAVNRSGQLRMLSQRLVLLYALEAAGDGAQPAAPRAEAADRVERNLAQLEHVLSRPTFGDLLDATNAAWHALRAALKPEAAAARLPEVDAAAERLLQAAEGLTASLEAASPLATLAVLNRSGRQRMLSQRLAKAALLATLCDGALAQEAAAEAVRCIEVFEAALGGLEHTPLSTPGIRAELEQARLDWRTLLAGLGDASTAARRAAIAAGSQALLDRFERLSGLYAQGVQSLFQGG